ncbi:MAG TPA: hypothetical protein DCY80_15920, partial [Solibacterales bacterium]|nr:hypothetical protein [Bryobacterales bacterium]
PWAELPSFPAHLRHPPHPAPPDWLPQAIAASEFGAPLAASPPAPNAPVTRAQAAMAVAAMLENR